MIGKIFVVALAFVFVIIMAQVRLPLPLRLPGVSDDPVVTFPDAKLEAVIRQINRKFTGDIHQSDLEKTINLNLSYIGISNLKGLAYCINLATLDLSHNSISNISPLNSLTNLTWLDLSYNTISNISPLSSLTNLTWLDLSLNRISNISPLNSLTNLTWLDLSHNTISNISPLTPLTNLTGLDLSHNTISNISPLTPLTNLTGLDLSLNRISNISSLNSLTNLTFLQLGDNRISDISPLVDNIGIDEGDEVNLLYNYLKLTPNSQTMNDIQTLQDRGVSVSYIGIGEPDSITPIGALLIIAVLINYQLFSLFQIKPILICGIIAAVVIIGIFIFFVVRTRRRPA